MASGAVQLAKYGVFEIRSVLQDSNAMVFAIGDIDQAITINQDAVRTRQGARARRTVRPFASLAGACYGLDDSGPLINAANRVALRVCDEHAAIGADGNALWSGEKGFPRRTAVPGVSLLSRSGQMVNRSPRHIEPINGVAFTQYQKHIPVGRECHRTRPIEGELVEGCAVRRGLALACSRESFDGPRLQIDAPDAVIADVADVEQAIFVQCDAVRLA